EAHVAAVRSRRFCSASMRSALRRPIPVLPRSSEPCRRWCLGPRRPGYARRARNPSPPPAGKAADEEFHIALAFHEAWKPSAYDKALHDRIGRSYALYTFRVIAAALGRELLLPLLRLWGRAG